MIIYHGSQFIVEKPVLNLGKKYNDYGQGFYCTEDMELAKEWACKNNTDGFVNAYDFDLKDLKVLDLSSDDYYVIHWIAILLKHRTFQINGPVALKAKEYILSHFYIDVNNYDVVIGYRADDSYFAYAQAFLNNTISLQGLAFAMHLGSLGTQVALVSEKAFEKLTFKKALKIDKNEYYQKYTNRDLHARKSYQEEVENSISFYGDIFVMDIIRKEMGIDELRI